MPEKHFDIVFTGQLLAPDRDKVKQDFAALFKISMEKADTIFAARRTVLKKSLPQQKALQYQSRLGDIGVLVSLEERIIDEVEASITLEPEEADNTEPQSSAIPDNTATTGNQGDDNMAESAAQQPDENIAAAAAVKRDDLSLQHNEQPQAGSTNFALVEDNSKVKRQPFEFSGNGAEFFKIWIVNIFLSIITLGIYSAWAKVRTHRYFYGNTRLAGSTFEYLADPVTILKGRIVAVVLFAAYTVAGEFYPPAAAVLLVVFLVVLPWLIMRSLRFRLRNTAYRNIRFGFDGSFMGAAKAYTLMFLLLPFTLGLLLPYMLFLQSQYLVNNARYGIDGFSFNVSPREYYRIYIVAFLALLVVLAGAAAFFAINPLLGALVVIVGYVLIATYLQVELINLMFDNSHLGDHQFNSTLEIGSYFKLYFVNTIGMILTLGLFYPWARVRIARYRADNLQMITRGSLDHYVASQREDVNALGEEVGDMFDVDLAI